MKKTVLFLIIALISFAGIAQTNSKGVLQKNVLKLNNGITLSKGDTIMLGTPVNDGNVFVFVKEPKHAFGLLGGDGADKKYSYKMLIIKFFTTSNNKENSEKKFVASLGYNDDEIILDCDIAEAIDNGEIIAKGRIPVRFNIAGVNNGLQKTEELPQKSATAAEKAIAPAIETAVEKTTEKLTAKNITSLLNKVNALHENGYISDSEHYQLLKIITGDSIENKKDIVKTLQTLRDSNKISISDYDELIDLFL